MRPLTTHHFQPTKYYTTIGSHPPELRIGDGDTVITSTVDASGRDAQNEKVAEFGNPQTGPFFIEGAEPGDTLAVHLDRITPNRDQGFSGALLAANVVEPWLVQSFPEWKRVYWSIDQDAGTATLAEPETALGNLTLPMRPMLGCFGVAPEGGQAISTSTSGPYGGNMDYRGFIEGVTVYFPVFVPGALFFAGDGHAVQGDGEIVGTGIEISCDVQFTVNVIKGKSIHWPRGENEEYYFCAGNARPLDQALQHATTEMGRYLSEDMKLDPYAAGLLLGMCVEYDVGNVYDPAYTMICKLPKRILRELGKRAAAD